jgi:hypothetical protein
MKTSIPWRPQRRASASPGLAGVDPDPDRQVQALGLLQPLERLQDPKAGAHSALGVVLVRDRGAEHGHDRVADELLNRAAVALDVGAQERVVRAHGREYVLRIGGLRARREPDEVAEQDRDDLALGAGIGGGRLQRAPAFQAELRVAGIVRAAARAQHGASLWRALGRRYLRK